MSNDKFILPEFYSFPPFFTIQPITETRKKQLELWRQLIIDYQIHHNAYKLNPLTFPLFSNDVIDRKLNNQGKLVVIDYLIAQGNAEWEDSSKTSLNVFYKPINTLADEIYTWVTNKGFLNNVLTIYELYAGDDTIDSGLHDVDPGLIRKALQSLESRGKCKIIYGTTSEEDGVKFLSTV